MVSKYVKGLKSFIQTVYQTVVGYIVEKLGKNCKQYTKWNVAKYCLYGATQVFLHKMLM